MSKGELQVRMLSTGTAEALPTRKFKAAEWGDLGDEVIEPPYAPENLVRWIDLSWMLSTSITARAQNVAGHGYYFAAREEVGEDETSPVAKAELELLQRVFEQPGEQSFTRLMRNVVTDLDSFGYAYLEVRPSKGGDPVAAFSHIPAHTMRVWVNDERRPQGFVQLREGEKRYFQPFGSKEKISYKTGEEIRDNTDRASYIIQFRHYSPSTDYYGVPPWVAAAPDIVGGRSAAEFNGRFFENNAVPEMAIIRKNATMNKESEDMLEQTLRHDHKGTSNRHKTLIIDVTSQPGTPAGTDADIRFEKLSSISDRDMGFSRYLQRGDDVIRGSFRLPPVLVGQTSQEIRHTADAGIKLAEGQVFAPMRSDLEQVFNSVILPAMQVRCWVFRFRGMDTTEPVERAEVVKAKKEAYTINDLRREEGLAVLDDELANVPLGLLPARLTPGQPAEEAATDDEARLARVLDRVLSSRESKRKQSRPFGR